MRTLIRFLNRRYFKVFHFKLYVVDPSSGHLRLAAHERVVGVSKAVDRYLAGIMVAHEKTPKISALVSIDTIFTQVTESIETYLRDHEDRGQLVCYIGGFCLHLTDDVSCLPLPRAHTYAPVS